MIETTRETAKSSLGKRPDKISIKGVKNVIAVTSAKGGVGKSTMAVNIASSLAKRSYKVGIIDSDIYGSSIYKMLAPEDKLVINSSNVLEPITRFGLRIISIGNLLETEKALALRGPMLTKIFQKMMISTNWGNLDYLIVDTPPGTGDVHITLFEEFDVTGSIVVSTPGKIISDISNRARYLMKKFGVLEICEIENMSYLFDPGSGSKSYIFGRSNRDDVIRIPFDIKVKEMAEASTPAVNNPVILKYFNEVVKLINEKCVVSN